MNFIEIIFWTLLFIVFYAYLGYGIVLFFLVQLKRLFSGKKRILMKIMNLILHYL